MINEISTIGIIILLILPFLFKAIFKLNDYYGFFLGMRYLAMNAIAHQIFNVLMPEIAPDKIKFNPKSEDVLKFSFNERLIKWSVELLNSIISFFIMNYYINQISKPTHNYYNIFMFISGVCIQYIIPFILFMILPALSTNEKLIKALSEQKIDPKYFTEEYALNSIKSTIFQIINTAGLCLIIMFHLKKLVMRGFSIINFFLENIIKFFIMIIGFTLLDKCYNLFNTIPFILGVYYYIKFVGNGKLNNKYKDEEDFE